MNKIGFILCITLLLFNHSIAQVTFKKNKDKISTHFRLINDVIILKIKVNGHKCNFILDTGVKTAILFDKTIKLLDSTNIRTINIRGLGKGAPIEAYYSSNNTIELKGLKIEKALILSLKDHPINLTSKFGIYIHGIIGSQLLSELSVRINYDRKKIVFYKKTPLKHIKRRRYDKVEIEIVKGKPYLKTNITLNDSLNLDVNLLLDSGANDGLWLFENNDIRTREYMYNDYLGESLSGSMYGKRTEIESLKIGKYTLKKAKTAFIDTLSIVLKKSQKWRGGTIGASILKRFNMVIDYRNKIVYFKKNSKFNKPYKYNKTGIEIIYIGDMYVMSVSPNTRNLVNRDNTSISSINLKKSVLRPIYKINYIRPSSRASKSGLKQDDVLVEINGEKTYNYNLFKLKDKLNKNTNNIITLKILRNGIEKTFIIRP